MKYFLKGRILRSLAVASLLLTLSCTTSRKISEIKRNHGTAFISLTSESEDRLPSLNIDAGQPEDTIKVLGPDGEQVFIMDAVREEDGQMVATTRLKAAVVTARFRNVAERHGKVRLEFLITVPESMQDTRWQLCFTPSLVVLQDSTALEKVVITGEDYRKKQLKGYQQYDRFLSKIITDSTAFIDLRALELFIMRNIPQIYAFKADSSFVSDEQFESVFGVDEHEAVEHYTDRLAFLANLRRIGLKDKMYGRYVKAPIIKEGIRLDTVLRAQNGDFEYQYSQELRTRPSLRKASVYLSGEILQEGEVSYSMPQTDPITFYISSLSSFVDDSPRYMDKVIERRAEANTACYIDYEQGHSDINPNVGHNPEELGRIEHNLSLLVEDEVFDLDSILVTSYASPEGSAKYNERLSLARARSAASYLKRYVDGARRDAGFSVNVGGNDSEVIDRSQNQLKFISRSKGENWTMLDKMVSEDPYLDNVQKEKYLALSQVANQDERELLLHNLTCYNYLRTSLYPRLRVVKFDFYLHRKGMVKDTVHTTVIDEAYARGVQAIKDRDYESAVKLLSPYKDYNLAVAYCAADRNESAMEILGKLPQYPQVLYMKALIYSRQQNVQKAVECYLDACRLEPSFVHRGNLDPEISSLVKRYRLNEE